MKSEYPHTTFSSSKPFSPKGIPPFFNPATIQPKLTIGQPNDKYEQEADAMANKVMRMPQNTPAIQTKCAGCEQEEKVQPKQKGNLLSLKRMIQKMDSPEEETLQTKPLIMKSEGGGEVANSALTSQLISSKGGGLPLPASTNQFMTNAFGSDFSGVRVHTGSKAIQMNQGLNARAFTHGSDVYFNRGEYRPDSSGGKNLLAHELTHVIQQKSGLKAISRAVKDKKCLVHAYDNSNPKDKAVIPDLSFGQMINALKNNSNTIGIGSVDDMVTKVNTYLNNSENNCKCVSKLEINGHGTDGYQSVGNGNQKVIDGKALSHESKNSNLEKLKKIKFCERGMLLLMGCHTGQGLGKTLLKKLSNILPGIIIGGAQHYTFGKGMGGKKIAGPGDKLDSEGNIKDPEKAKPFLSSPYVNWHLTIGEKEYVITGADAKSASAQSKLKVADSVKIKTPEGEIIKIK